MPLAVAGLIICVGLVGYIAVTELYRLHLLNVSQAKHCPPNCATCALSH